MLEKGVGGRRKWGEQLGWVGGGGIRKYTLPYLITVLTIIIIFVGFLKYVVYHYLCLELKCKRKPAGLKNSVLFVNS